MNVFLKLCVLTAATRRWVGLGVLALAVTTTASAQTNPGWWSTSSVTDGNPIDNYTALNAGQLKNMVSAASAQIGSLPNGFGSVKTSDGQAIPDVVAGWSATLATDDQYAAVNLGQLANMAQPFLKRLTDIGYYASNPFVSPTDNYLVANIGQLENLFNFDVALKTNSANEVPDWWATGAGLNPSNATTLNNALAGLTANATILNADGSRSTYLQAYENNVPPATAAAASTGVDGTVVLQSVYVPDLYVSPALSDPDLSKVYLKWNLGSGSSSTFNPTSPVEIQWKQGTNAPWQTLGTGQWSDSQFPAPTAAPLQLYSCLNYSFRITATEADGTTVVVSSIQTDIVPVLRSVSVQHTWSQVKFPGFLPLNYTYGSGPAPTKYLSAVYSDPGNSTTDSAVFDSTGDTDGLHPTLGNPKFTSDYSDPTGEQIRTFIEGYLGNANGSRTFVSTSTSSSTYNITQTMQFTLGAIPGGYWSEDFITPAGFNPWLVLDSALAEPPPMGGIGSLQGEYHEYGAVLQLLTSGLGWTVSVESGTDNNANDTGSGDDWSTDVVPEWNNPGNPMWIPVEPLPNFYGTPEWLSADAETISSDGASAYNSGHTVTLTLSVPFTTTQLDQMVKNNLADLPNDYSTMVMNSLNLWGNWGGAPHPIYFYGANPYNYYANNNPKLAHYYIDGPETVIQYSHGKFRINIFPVASTPDVTPVVTLDEITTPLDGSTVTHSAVTWNPPANQSTAASNDYVIDPPTTNAEITLAVPPQ